MLYLVTELEGVEVGEFKVIVRLRGSHKSGGEPSRYYGLVKVLELPTYFSLSFIYSQLGSTLLS